jgi:allantoate deiminase
VATTAVLSRFGASDRAQLAADAGHIVEMLRRHGAGADGGVTRLVYSPEWRAAMADIEDWLSGCGLVVRHDAVGSRFGRLQGESPSVVLSGSHIDSVKQGGAYDGTLGVVMAGCAIAWLGRNMGKPRRTLEVFANCEEESSRFASNFWGARALTGRISPGETEALTDEHGEAVGSAMRACGLDPVEIGTARRRDVGAYVEPHIEQGPVLVEAGDVIGVVDRVVAVRVISVTLDGVSGHAGTVPMARRHDALAGAAEIMAGAERIAQRMGAPAVATVGSIAARPGGFNQVPGQAAFTVDFRHPDDDVLAGFDRELRDLIREVASRRGLESRLGQVVDQPGIHFDPRICADLEASCVESATRWRRMPSHAGHDAQVIGTICPAAMLFVPSQGGHSHRPDERTELDHIGAGIEVLVRTLFRLAYLDS